ncbi:GntR family transcriptional regulator [Phenylobacterium sp. LjRoot225]|uniref:FadR/GntR family transcriptional regulator n=1 Tax=Phenylobacterium sp. LjRoot225 TaxID=3342285 RepID=UPI003ED01F40
MASRRVQAEVAPEPIKGVARRPVSWELGRRTLKTSEVVALEIVRDIVAQELKPGDRLPLESEMLVQYRVSRSSLREALRLLEVQGLIVIRPGPGAGTVVGRVVPANVARTLTLHLHMLGANYEQLLEAWIEAEPMLARLAARNPDRKRVNELLSPFLEEDHAWAVREGLMFHDIVGELAANPVLSLTLQPIGYIVTEQVLTSAERGELEEHIVHHHRDVAEAIIAGNEDLAAERMREHIRHEVAHFKSLWPLKIGDKVHWR